MLRPVVKYLRENGLRINLFVDDFLLISQAKYMTDHKDLFLHTLTDLGWRINFDKSQLEPSTKCRYLGFIIDSCGPEGVPYIKVVKQRIQKLRRDIQRCLSTGNTSARVLARIAGQCVSMTKAVLPAKLLLNNIYRTIAKRKAWDSVTVLNDSARTEIEWWLNALTSWNGAPIAVKPIEVQIQTDASGTGWGAKMGPYEASGLWDAQIAHMQSNYRELLCVGMALQSFAPMVKGKSVQILSDNVCTVACINKLYTPSQEMHSLSQAVWLQAHNLGITLQGKFLCGTSNFHADRLSRVWSPYEWK